MEKYQKKTLGNYTYRCIACALVFLPEEVPDRFNKQKKTCIRCLVDKQIKERILNPPACYGKKYDGASESCVLECTLREACIIEMVDSLSGKWVIQKCHVSPKAKIIRSSGRPKKYIHIAVRLLRTAGRPMHIHDLAPLVSLYNDNGRRYIRDTAIWQQELYTHLTSTHEIVMLGQGFCVWAGVWDIRKGGYGGGHLPSPSETLLSIEEIFKDL